MTEIRVTITNGDGGVVDVDPLIEAMIRMVIKGTRQIMEKRQGYVELHYNSVTGQVAGKVKDDSGISE